jgi:hypothetical protein
MSKRLPREHATQRAAPIVVAVLVGAVAGAGTTVVAAPLPRSGPPATAADTNAKMQVTRGGKTWMSAEAILVGQNRWAAQVRSHRYITPGRYRIRVKFRSPGGDPVVRYKARLTAAR